jgi:hypothetical protein
MKQFLCVIVLIALSAAMALAQPKFETGVVFSSGFPQGEFSQNVSHAGLGVTWDFFYRVSRTPFSIGTSMGFLTYGSQSRAEILSPTIPDVVVSVDTTNNILLTHFLLRYQPPISSRVVRPYVEGLVGFNYLWTQTSLGGGSDQITSTNFSDSAISYGAGAGMSLCLHQGGMPSYSPAYRVDLNLGVRYLFGGQAEYLNEGAIRTVNGDVYYSVNRSNTDLLVATVGVGFTF